MSAPVVAIVGAPNVGKSTLFNRLVGGRRAIVGDEPGVTRDRIYGEVRDARPSFVVVDTGGLTLNDELPLARAIEAQARAALAEAGLVLFVVDARAGATALDHEIASMLRRLGGRPLLVANKVDGPAARPHADELYALGLGPPIDVSAEHGRGIEELVAAITDRLPPPGTQADRPAAIGLAIVGRPNVGKSSLVNRLLGEERVLVGERPGTTRDAIDALLEVRGRRYRIVDTAGLRRPGKIQREVERVSALKARQNIERADVAVLVLDASEPLVAQDAHVAGHILAAFKPLVVVLNKWDLVQDREAQVKVWEERIRRKLRFTHGAPLAFVSARTGQRVLKILDLADQVHAASGVRVPTQRLNRWLQEHPASGAVTGSAEGPGLRLMYATQVGVHPPSFLLFCNDPARAPASTRRHIENSLRASFGLGPAPIRLEFRGRRAARRR